MRPSPFDHIDLRVRKVTRARRFYDAFLPAVGFTHVRAGGRGQADDQDEPWAFYGLETPGEAKPPFIWLTEEPDHRGGANRIAFWAGSEAEVDRLAAVVRAAGAQVIEGPEYCYEYTPGYYAVFFEDEDGNKWEVCFRDAPVRPKPAQADAAGE